MGTKAKHIKIRLISEAGTGYYYTTTKNPKKEKMRMRKFDPRAPIAIEEGSVNASGRTHGAYVWFKEGKIK